MSNPNKTGKSMPDPFQRDSDGNVTALRLPTMARDLNKAEMRFGRAKIKDPTDEDGERELEVMTLSFPVSSERAVERWWGTEVLDHSKDAVRMDRANDGAMPLLFNHRSDQVAGMVRKMWIEKKRTWAEAYFMPGVPTAQNVEQMVRGGLRNVSISYDIYVIEEDKKTNTWTARDWEIFEVSIVTVPADPSVGIGRSLRGADDEQFREVRIVRSSESPADTAVSTEVTRMSDKDKNASAGATADDLKPKSPTQVEVTRDEKPQPTTEELMKQRKQIIRNLCEGAGLDVTFAQNLIERPLSMEQVSEEIVRAVKERGVNDPQTPAMLGLTKKEVQRYSILRALRSSMSRDWSKAGIELEAHKAICQRGLTPRGDISFFVPYDLLVAPHLGRSQRDMTVAGVSGSNFLVGTDHLAGSFIDLLRAQSIALRLGFTRLQGLKGNVAIPRQTAGGTVFWLADENTAITESQPTIGQLNLTPKNVAALTEISHTLVMQSDPSVDTLVMNNIARDIGTGVDIAAIRGSGAAGQPQGIVGTSGVGSVTGTALAYPGILEFQSDVGLANALGLGGGAYVTTFPVAADMKATMIAANTFSPIWVGRMEEGSIDTYPAIASGNMAAGHMIFGAWGSGILAEWGVLELMMNPFSDFTRGLTSIRGWYTCDIGLRYPGAWSVSTNVT